MGKFSEKGRKFRVEGEYNERACMCYEVPGRSSGQLVEVYIAEGRLVGVSSWKRLGRGLVASADRAESDGGRCRHSTLRAW